MKKMVVRKISTLFLSMVMTVSLVTPALADDLIAEDIVSNDVLTEDTADALSYTAYDLITEDTLIEETAEETVNEMAAKTTAVSDPMDTEVSERMQYILENDPGVIWMPVEDNVYSDDEISCDSVSQIGDVSHSYTWPETDLNKEQRDYVIRRCKEIVAEVTTEDMSDIEKYVALRKWIDINVKYPSHDSVWYNDYTYDIEKTPHGAHGALKYGYGVCQGKTLLYSHLCHAADLPCDEICMPKNNHICNYIPNINGYSYVIDMTGYELFHSVDANSCRSMYDFPKGYENECHRRDFEFNIVDSTADYLADSYYIDINNVSEWKKWIDPEFLSDWCGRTVTMIEPYVEKGSGVHGTHYAHYADYALQSNENTGNWELDDFYMFPKSQLDKYIDIEKTQHSGLKNQVLKGEEFIAYSNQISADLVLSYNGKVLTKDVDYEVANIYYNKNLLTLVDGTIVPGYSITIKGLGDYYGRKYISIYEKYNEESVNPIPYKPVIKKNFSFTASSYVRNTNDVFSVVSDIDGIDVIFTSSKPDVASIDDKGLVTALAKGITTITASTNGKTYKAKVTVYDPKLTGTDVLMLNKKTQTLKVTGGKGKTTWSSSDTSVVTVDKNGKIKGISKGTTVITAINNGRTMTKTITTFNVPKFEEKTYVTNLDEPLALNLIKDEDLDGIVYSVNSKIASIDQTGYVTPIKKGTVTVSAKVSGITVKAKLQIYDPVISGKNLVKVGKTLGFSIKNGYGTTFWSVDDESIATITSKGKLKGLSKGTVTVTAVNNGRKMSKKVIVE